ncbi:MAG: THUMP domain-containing protein [Bacteroides sp.]|nr:THUMP domain-containing protein [Roseburia sp.]MCM1346375.1 THUMP domain-containing protein [Bacteroides sp.]MCM1420410.1 THUMP domain-containing protein [Bacteroides sp.]
METQEFKIIAKTFQGLEEVLAKEITELGANNIEIGRRMVSFTGDKEMLYRANFCLRTAVKVLKPIRHFQADDADEVYEVVKKMDWETYMDCSNTFLVDAVVFSEKFRHSKFAAYRVKDGIADYFREKTGERPNVSITNPDIRINIHIADNDVTISLDSSGESLHQRGYRTGTVPAPLNEVLAAGMIMLSGWNGECDLIDPMCGSGTILIEAALIAMNIYPGVFRKEFAFEKWKDFDEDLFDKIYNDDSQERDFDHKIYGYDINRQAVAIAQDNARSAGVNKVVDIMQRDFYEFEQPVEKAMIITNPPYGERITTDDLLGLYETIGERLKHAFVGNDAWVLSYREECFAKIGMRPSTRYALFNGALECEFRKYQVFDGKLSDRREEGLDIKSEDERMHNMKFKPHRRREEDEDEGYEGKRGSRDDDHYFKSRPYNSRKPFDKDKKPFDRTKKGSFSFYKDDEDTELDRRTFKWGDRKPGKWDESESSSKSFEEERRSFNKERRLYDRDRRSDDREKRPFDRERKPFDRDRKPYDKDRKPYGREDKPYDRDRKKYGEKKYDDRNRKDFRERRDDRGRNERKEKWGFDSEGRPFRREKTEE